MKDTVDDIANKFGLPVGVEARGLPQGFLNTDEDVTGERTWRKGRRGFSRVVARVRIVECYNIGRPLMPKMRFVQSRDLSRVHKMNAQTGLIDLEFSFEQGANDPLKNSRVYTRRARPVLEENGWPHSLSGCSRCMRWPR